MIFSSFRPETRLLSRHRSPIAGGTFTMARHWFSGWFLPRRTSSEPQMRLKKIVGKKLKAIRLKQGLTIQELALRSRVSSNMISRVERGLTIPSVQILMKLAEVFEKSINYFVEEVTTTHEVVFSSPGQRDTTVYDDEH